MFTPLLVLGVVTYVVLSIVRCLIWAWGRAGRGAGVCASSRNGGQRFGLTAASDCAPLPAPSCIGDLLGADPNALCTFCFCLYRDCDHNVRERFAPEMKNGGPPGMATHRSDNGSSERKPDVNSHANPASIRDSGRTRRS